MDTQGEKTKILSETTKRKHMDSQNSSQNKRRCKKVRQDNLY